MTHRTLVSILVASSLLLGSCAGYRGGWESVAYIEGTQPNFPTDATPRALRAPELLVPGLRMQVSIDNQLRTYDRNVAFGLPVSNDPRNTQPKNIEPGKTRVFVTVTPELADFVFEPSLASLHVAGQHFSGIAGFEFDRWDDAWNRVERGGRWEHRPIDSQFVLADVGRRYHLSIDFATPTPSPQGVEIALDLSRALRSSAVAPIPMIRFAPVRWKEGYT